MSTANRVEQALQAFGLKGRNNQFQCNSPFRAGSDSMGFSLTIEDDEHGAWFDHVSGEKGTLYELAEKLGIETPKREKVEISKRGYDSLAEYAELKAIPEQVFIDAKWEQISYYDNRPCFVFPTQGGLRYRFIDGKSPKFKSVTGFNVCWYGLDRAIAIAHKTAQALILCNGEPSTLVGQYHGIAAFCMPGGENHHVTPELLDELKAKWKGDICIALDCDLAGQQGTKKFTEPFSESGIKHTVIDLMLTKGGDLADYCKLHGESTLADLAKLPKLGKATVQAKAERVDDASLKELVKQLLNLRKSENESDNILKTLDTLQTELDMQRRALFVTPIVGGGVEFLDAYDKRMEEARKGITNGMSSGMEKIDDLTGMFKPGRVYTVLAETGMGKSTLVSSFGSEMLKAAPGLIVPTESMPLDWFNKLVSHRTYIPTDVLEDGKITDEQAAKIYATTSRLIAQGCRFLDKNNPTVDTIVNATVAGIQNDGFKWVIIDAGSNVNLSGKSSLYEKTEAAMDMAQELARLGLIVIITIQTGRNMDGRALRIPQSHDGKGSGRIEENSDVILGLYNHNKLVALGEAEPDNNFPMGTILVRCNKNRWRGKVEGKAVHLRYEAGVGVYQS